jgi:hypothetical protein
MKPCKGSVALLLLAGIWCAGLPSLSASQAPSVQPRFDVNDVSFLWPPPTTKEDVDALVAGDTKTDDGSPLWPTAAFQAVLQRVKETAVANLGGGASKIRFDDGVEDAFKKAATWKVVGFRVDPSAPGGHPDLVKQFGAMPQLRLILQPVTIDAGRIRVHDFAAHLVFGYFTGPAALPFTPDRDKFREIVADLAALKAASTRPTEGRLGVHPALKTRDAGFASQVKAFLARHTSPSRSRLFAISFMGVEVPEPWIFLAMRVAADGTIVEAPQRTLGGKPAQMLAFLNTPRAQPVPVTTNVDPAAGKGVSTGVLFANDVLGTLDAPALPGLARPLHRDIPDLVANPQRAHFFNTDCVSCHTESTRRDLLQIPEGDKAFRFAVAAGVSSVDPNVLPKSAWNVRNFGWFQRGSSGPTLATVTMRAANEAAESVDLINRDYLASAAPGTPAPARMVRASFRPAGNTSTARARRESPQMADPVASPLTLVMNIKSPQDQQALKTLIDTMQALPPGQNPIAVALTKLKTVHFARFVFLNDQQLAVITTYDGRFEDYIDAFVMAIGPIFDRLLSHMKDAPPLPVSTHRDEFLAYVQKHDLTCVPPFYSAYPALSVQDVLTLQKQQGLAH